MDTFLASFLIKSALAFFIENIWYIVAIIFIGLLFSAISSTTKVNKRKNNLHNRDHYRQINDERRFMRQIERQKRVSERMSKSSRISREQRIPREYRNPRFVDPSRYKPKYR